MKTAERERRCMEEGRPALHSLVKLSGVLQFEVQLCKHFPTRQTQSTHSKHYHTLHSQLIKII